MIYLDNASTTRVFDEVNTIMADINNRFFYNPSALYKHGLLVKDLLDSSRKSIAEKLNSENGEIFFTSCATESNNWILQNALKNKKGNLIISAGEHSSVYNCATFLKSKGINLRIVRLLPDGTLDIDDLENKLDADTSLVSIIHCSNETGAINDLAAITKIIRKISPSAIIHSDGVQAFCKIATDVNKLGVHFYTVTAHKIGGPKGCGAVYINKNVKIPPFFYGGGQESGQRSGTENTAGIAGFAKAVEVFNQRYNQEKTNKIYHYLKNLLLKNGWVYNGADNHSGFILSLSYPKIKSEVLQRILCDDGVLIGLGSACSSKLSSNRVLSAIGRAQEEIEGNIRLSFCVDSSLEEAKVAGEKILKAMQKLV